MKLVPFMAFAPPGATSLSAPIVYSISFDAPGADHWPDFVRVPAARELASLWPPGTTGAVSVGCRVPQSGIPDLCEVLAPTNPSPELTTAALRAMALFRFSPAIRGGRSIEANVIVPFNF